jgi:hypothetical protein
MTKQTNYVATATDANSVFPPKGQAIPNSNRGLITATAGQREGSIGAKDSWYIDLNAQPLASYPNNRLPRWQDLIPLSCSFTFGTVQVPSVTPPVLDSTTGITIFFDSSGSMEQVLPALEAMKNNVLKPCLLPYYNNDTNLYNQRVTILSYNDEFTIKWLGALPINGATKTVNLTFSNECHPDYTNTSIINPNCDTSVTPWVFLPNGPPTSYYTNDINFTKANLSDNIRGISYRIIYYQPAAPAQENANFDNITKGFYTAVYTGQGNYSGASGLSTTGYAYLIDDVSYSGNGQYYANKVIEGMNLLGYNLSPC